VLTVSLEGHPDKLDDFEDLLDPMASWSSSAPDGWRCPNSIAVRDSAP
jgi:hypothetical protein